MRAVGAFAVVALLMGARAAAAPGALPRELELARHPPRMAPGGDDAPVAPPTSDTEKRLREDLACLCGSCRKEPIATCTCDFAASMRAEVARALVGRDLSTAAAQKAAYDAVRAAFATKYGAAVLTPQRHDPAGRRAGWLPPLIFAVGALWLALVGRRSLRRRRDAANRAAPPPDAE